MGMIKNVHIYNDGSESYPWCVAFTGQTDLTSMKKWLHRTFTREDCDWTAISFGEVWFEEESGAALFVLRWS